jgi:hypothetical protein
MYLLKKETTLRSFLIVCFFCLLLPGNCYAEYCYAKGDGFAVIQPYLVEKVCFLYEHSKNLPPESEMKQTLGGDDSLHPDPLMSEFLYLIVKRRYTAIKKGTAFFNCGYDLKTLKIDPAFAQLNGIILPEFHCRGFLSSWVPVRIINENNCWWVALELVDCGNIPDDYDVDIRWKR